MTSGRLIAVSIGIMAAPLSDARADSVSEIGSIFLGATIDAGKAAGIVDPRVNTMAKLLTLTSAIPETVKRQQDYNLGLGTALMDQALVFGAGQAAGKVLSTTLIAPAGPSPNFRIGFGDYFDCDSLPEFGISVMAWSETANGQQPWQSWVRIVDRWEWEDERVSALEDEIDRLTEAFELGELPFPRTDENVARFKARVEELRKTQSAAQIALQKRRDSNHVPAE